MSCENPLFPDPPVILELSPESLQTDYSLDVHLRCSNGCLMIDGTMEANGQRQPFSCSLRMASSRAVSMTETLNGPSSSQPTRWRAS